MDFKAQYVRLLGEHEPKLFRQLVKDGQIDQYLQTKSVWCELSTVAQDPFVMRS